MSKPQRIQLSRRKGFNLQRISMEFNGLPAVNCARPSKFGNPFVVGSWLAGAKIDRRGAVKLFRQLLKPGSLMFKDAQTELRGKNLACWCKNDGQTPCHCDVLLKIANA